MEKLKFNLNETQNKLELMLQRKQIMTFSIQLVHLINLYKFRIYCSINKQFNEIIHSAY